MFRGREPQGGNEGLFWPAQERDVTSILQKVAKEKLGSRSTLFRSATSEVSQGYIAVDPRSGIISIPAKEIPSQAYANGGWNAVLERAENQFFDIDLLVSEDPGMGLAVVTWTSPNPFVATTFKDPNAPDLTLMIINPDKSRVKVSTTDSSSIDNYDDGDIEPNPDNAKLEQAIEREKPFTIIGHSTGQWREVLLGPYIKRNELKTVVHIPQKEIPGFSQVLKHTFPGEEITEGF